MNTELSRVSRFRSTILDFLETRRSEKLKEDEADTEKASKYEYETWLADAARRVGQIQAVTHVLKATHPDARGSSLHIPPDQLQTHAEIGSHLLGPDFALDVVGNAAALDVFKFLKLEVDSRPLLDWMKAGDSDLRAALHTDTDTAADWMSAFASLVRAESEATSHVLAKQVYWLVGARADDDLQYHLLQPLFSSSLAHVVHADIQETRFGETNTLARKLFRASEASDTTYRSYRGLVARKLGGTKPQNISQLNSERRGINYLLASVPPSWKSDRPRDLLGLKSAMDRLAHSKDVRRLVKALGSFLLGDPAPTQQTRETRKRIEQALGAQLAVFGAEIHASQEPGWSRDAKCILSLTECLWLDPERTELPLRCDPAHPEWERSDQEFNAAYAFGDWPDKVAELFANWINARLRDAGLTAVGDTEFRHWARQAVVDAAWPITLRRRVTSGGPA